MSWKKGECGNPNGRPKGSKNKTGTELRRKIADFLAGQFDAIAADFDALEAKERYKLFVALLPYCIGKKQDLTFEGQVNRLSDDELEEVIDTLKEATR